LQARHGPADILTVFMSPEHRKIGVLTGGGDAPGLNAVIRAVVKAGANSGMEVIGLDDSFDGLLDSARSRRMTRDVTGILRLGGTILGTTTGATRSNIRPTAARPTIPTASSRRSARWVSTRRRHRRRRDAGDRASVPT
jgi:hypothetical protein